MSSSPLVIDVKDLNKSFNHKPAVRNFKLQLKQGEICGFLGPNGSGKTTTLRMLCGLLTPDSGSGQCLSYDILRQSYEIKKQVGYMTQNFSLYGDMTTQENLDFIARIYAIKNRQATIEETLHSFNLVAYRDQLASELSGGWKQRLALAGCMLHQPKLLLLDEPTAGVDPKARRYFWDIISYLSQRGITTLVSTHYMDEAERCTRLVYINNGTLLAEGSIQEITLKAGLTTWQVAGEQLMSLAEKLSPLPGIKQVVFFGNKLHVSGENEAELNKSIAPFKDSNWEKISSNLEDVFISLVDEYEGRK